MELLAVLVGTAVGGLISLGSTLWAQHRQYAAEANRQREQRAQDAAKDLVEGLDDYWKLLYYDATKPQQSRIKKAEAERNIRERMKISALFVTDRELRTRILATIDLLAWDLAFRSAEKQWCVKYLLECCGAFLRGEALPAEPQFIRDAQHALEDHLSLQEELQSELES